MDSIAAIILESIGKYVVAPVGRQIGYLCYLNRNIETLIDEVGKLENARIGIQMRVQTALNNVENIEPAVEKWLVEAHKVVGETQIFIKKKAELPKGCLCQWCLNLKPRYALSRDAKEKTKNVQRLKQECQFGNIACPAPLIPSLASTSTTKTFHTHKSILEEIIMNLQEDKIDMIGICGMGGVGKTTMVEEVWKRVGKEKLFDDYAMVVISQKQDHAKIQSDIADMLGLSLHEQNPIAREAKLHRRLENKRVLIILDDVWAEFDLKLLGITFRKGCKVLFTSRERDLWTELETKIDFHLDVLEENEAWDLFEGKVRNSLQNKPELIPVAKEIVKECRGLPLALVTIGSALIGKSEHLWRDTLRQLKTGYPSKARGVSAKVYQSLELSYNFLDEEEAKSLFLLCCLFEEDFDIPVEDLVKMGLGLRLFRGVNGLEQARDRAYALVEKLKSRYLLLPGKKRYDYFSGKFIYTKEHIRMHDVVRDVAKSIAGEEKGALILENGTGDLLWKDQDTVKKFKWISIISKEITELPIELRSSQVKLLKCNNGVLKITDDFFKDMEELKVLDLYYMKYPELPSSLQLPNSLRTLCFRECDLRNITFTADLMNLEILDLGLSKIEELPVELGCSCNLLLVDLRKCHNIQTIQAGILSRLCQLQELYVGDIEIDWEGGENEEGKNASIREFESLVNLHTLHIQIKDANIFPRSPLFTNLKKYKIQIGDLAYFRSYDKCFSISFHTYVPVKGDIEFFSRDCEQLQLFGKYASKLVHELIRDGCPNLKYLKLCDIDTLEHVTNGVRPLLLNTLETIILLSLENLQHISSGPLMLGSFGKLKSLHVCECSRLRNVFQLSIVKQLVHLENLTVRYCESMEEVIRGEREDNASNKLAFPKLKNLDMYCLPKLISFCNGIDELEFPQLKRLALSKLPLLVAPFSGVTNQSIFPPKVSFPRLEEIAFDDLVNMKEIWCGQYLQSGSFRNLTRIIVVGCDGISSVMTPSMARYLVHLQDLNIKGCSLLEVVVDKEDEEDCRTSTLALLPALEYVIFRDLPVLESFCHVAHDLEFAMLNYLSIERCPKIKTFSPAPVNTPNLNNVKLGFRIPSLWVGNLNSTIMHLHQQVMPS